LKSQLDNVENLICRLTEDQFKFLDVIEANKRVLCSGGAGTGKTFMAVELCRRFSSTEKILFVCKSKILENYLYNLLKLNNTIISTIESLKVKTKRNNFKKYDILIVDEGQDICNFTDLELIGDYLKGGWENGQWAFFSDINNQANIIGEFEEDAMEYLKSCTPVEIPLKKNCRNTEPIMKKIQDLTNFDMGNKGTGIGPDVRHVYCQEEPEHYLAAELKRLSKKNIPRENIIVLSPQNFLNSCVNKLTNSSKAKIEIVDERNISNPALNKIKFSQISNYKGLESQCVILVDIDKSVGHYDAMLYVGMSRAKALLTIIFEK
jgi:DNA helicase IV